MVCVQVLLKRKWDPYTTNCLQDCSEMYGDASSSMSGIITEYNVKRYADASFHLSAVEEDPMTCESQFKQPKPLTTQNGEAIKLTSLSLAIINLNLK